jgi:hypothetical protein
MRMEKKCFALITTLSRLGLEKTNGSNSIPRFSPGNIIRGKLKAENCYMKKVKKATVQLSGIEHPRWGRPNIMMENIKKEIKYNEDNDDNIITFGIQIPQNAKRSYSGKYSGILLDA